MSRASLFEIAYLALFSQPAEERAVYRELRRLRAASIVELGIGDGTRARRMIQVAARYRPDRRIRYTGIDLFEARETAAAGMSLKQAHQHLQATGAQIRLIPGDPYSALARMSNSLTGTDLVVIGADQAPEALEPAWFYLPRMIHERSRVLWAGASGRFRMLDAEAVRRRAAGATDARRAA